MRIAWFTPYPPEKSAVAEYSVTIVSELRKMCDVDLWVAVSDEEDREITDNRYAGMFRIINFHQNPGSLESLSSYNAVVYNMGNNLKFHRDIYEVSKLHPGIVILHDYVLHHFFAAYHLLHRSSKEDYIKEMERNHGAAGGELARDILAGRAHSVWETDNVLNFPLNRSALDNATGVIVHSHFARNKLKAFYRGPIKSLNFPAPPAVPAPGKDKTELGIPRDKILILTFGEVNPNKRIASVLKVLGERRDLADKVIYVIIGKEHRTHFDIRPLLEKYRLQDSVRILGYQPREVLNEFISASDLCLNLRYPTMGESSWSLIQVLLSGKPALVTRTGWYDELDDDCVVKIDPGKEEEELAFQIERLCGDANLRAEIGRKARTFAKASFSTEGYCDELTGFVTEVRRRRIINDLIDRVSEDLLLMGVRCDDRIVDVVAETIYGITAEPSSPERLP